MDAAPTAQHPSTTSLLRYFEYEHLPSHLAWFSAPFHGLAHEMADHLPDDDELRAGLRKLLEAKDCMVRAALDLPPALPELSPVLVAGCPHCPDGHTGPEHGQPWGVYVAAERDGDGQPVRLHVERAGGAHVAESDAEWVLARIRRSRPEAL